MTRSANDLAAAEALAGLPQSPAPKGGTYIVHPSPFTAVVRALSPLVRDVGGSAAMGSLHGSPAILCAGSAAQSPLDIFSSMPLPSPVPTAGNIESPYVGMEVAQELLARQQQSTPMQQQGQQEQGRKASFVQRLFAEEEEDDEQEQEQEEADEEDEEDEDLGVEAGSSLQRRSRLEKTEKTKKTKGPKGKRGKSLPPPQQQQGQQQGQQLETGDKAPVKGEREGSNGGRLAFKIVQGRIEACKPQAASSRLAAAGGEATERKNGGGGGGDPAVGSSTSSSSSSSHSPVRGGGASPMSVTSPGSGAEVSPRRRGSTQRMRAKSAAVKMQLGEAPTGERRNPCNCRKSKCLKLYCECFSVKLFCKDCKCQDCHNNSAHESARQAAIKATLERNPNAFKPKIASSPGLLQGQAHTTGCRCKKSNCLKRYCECFLGEVFCGPICKCQQCKNFKDSPELLKRRKNGTKAATNLSAAMRNAAQPKPSKKRMANPPPRTSAVEAAASAASALFRLGSSPAKRPAEGVASGAAKRSKADVAAGAASRGTAPGLNKAFISSV